MTGAERIALALAQRFPELDAALLARRPPFRAALADALAVMSETEVVEHVTTLGALTGARNGYGVLIARLREIRALDEDRRRMADEECEERRWAAVDRAVARGGTLRQLVDAGTIFADEAAHLVASEFPDDDLRGIARAALGGVT